MNSVKEIPWGEFNRDLTLVSNEIAANMTELRDSGTHLSLRIIVFTRICGPIDPKKSNSFMSLCQGRLLITFVGRICLLPCGSF